MVRGTLILDRNCEGLTSETANWKCKEKVKLIVKPGLQSVLYTQKHVSRAWHHMVPESR